MSNREFEVRLVGGRSPDGEIELADLAAIARSLQELSLRIGRSLDQREGPGRTRRTVEDLTQLRLRALGQGSTRLVVGQGPSDTLEMDPWESVQISDRFWEVLTAIALDDRPTWVPDLVSDSAADLVTALQGAATTVEFSGLDRPLVAIQTEKVKRETWTTPHVTTGSDMVVVAGLLEKVDLHSHAFRIRDDVGNTIELQGVRDPYSAARLVGTHITASGSARRNRSGRLTAVTEPEVRPEDAELASFRIPEAVSTEALLNSAPGPDPDFDLGLSDEEFAAFLRAIRE